MRWFALFLAVTLAGCVSPVVVDHRAGTDFGSYRTYAIDPPEQDEKALSLDGQRVQAARVEAVLDSAASCREQERNGRHGGSGRRNSHRRPL